MTRGNPKVWPSSVSSVQLLRTTDPQDGKNYELQLTRKLRGASREAKTLGLLMQNDRCPKKFLFPLSKTTFLMPEGVQKAPLGDPSED